MQSNYQFVSADTNEIVTRLTTLYEQMCGTTVLPASPERLFILWIASVIVQVTSNINIAANQNIPSRASGVNLDALAELVYAKSRPVAKPASCTVRFSISEAQLSAILVPAGTRVTDASKKLVWKTKADAYISIGDTYIDVTVECETAGVVGNGYTAGQINTAVDIYPYYSGCINSTESGGGSDAATDDEFYEILRASMNAYTTAGPVGAYTYWAKSVSTEIKDVVAIRPRRTITKTLTVYAGHAFLGGDNLDKDTLEVIGATLTTDYTAVYADGLLDISIVADGALDGESAISVSIDTVDAGMVNIYALMEDGTTASSSVKTLIAAACSSNDVRPLTDSVSVEDLSTQTYNIAITYYISRNSAKPATEIEAAVTAAVNEYKKWQCAKIGRDINPSKLISLLMQAGVKRVVLTAPTYAALKDGSDHSTPQIASIGTSTVTAGGYEDE